MRFRRHSDWTTVVHRDRFNDWIQRITEGKIDRALQNEIADKILAVLEQKKHSLGTREKILLARAVTALSTSIKSTYRPGETGLRSCLIALREISNPENVLDESFAERDDEAKHIDYAMLVTTLENIKEQIS